ncbi:MAG: alpha-galactosidase [Clostridia bacterium]|nr:alpha-galactosidase [Clostridia bacterium]
MEDKIIFHDIEFTILNGAVYLTRFGRVSCGELREKMHKYAFSEVQLTGQMKETHMGIKLTSSSEAIAFKYHSHRVEGDTLFVTQRSGNVEATTAFTTYTDTGAVSIYSEYKNITDGEIILEDASAIRIPGFGRRGVYSADNLYYYSFTQSHHVECQPRRKSFFDYGMYHGCTESQKRISFANVGSWSTKEQLPQGIIEDTEEGYFLMFQIESNNSWYYEIGDADEEYYLYLGGGNLANTSWWASLAPGESYKTPRVALAFGSDLNSCLCEMTKYRRHIKGVSAPDASLPTIFNEYMHLSWDSPTAETTAKYAPAVAKTGVKYYVIDCGWHNEEDGDKVYPYVGQWKESHARFPRGVRETTDYLRSLGLRPGLWIEPEIVGWKCREMLEYYDDDCFLTRFGRRIGAHGRYFLDYRNEKVRAYMTETIRRMVEDYGAEYIKLDYNQDIGVGTDKGAESLGRGLEACSRAYLDWVDEIRGRFPSVIFETCSSGGMRMDYETLSHFSLISTSDQVSYKKYPYIVANILSAVLPEQAAVWSYPVSGIDDFEPETVKREITDEVIVINMINSFLGRMHLASHLDLLSDEKIALIREGVEYYDTLTEGKYRALPFLPNGFADFRDKAVASGYIVDGHKLYLALWNLGSDKPLTVELGRKIKSCRVGYPNSLPTDFTAEGTTLTVKFDKEYMARFFEIEVE